MSRQDIEFQSNGLTLRGWFYPAEGATGPAPTIVMAHGLSAVKEMYLGDYASFFAAAGLNVVVYDHAGFGDSDGELRQEVDPVMQVRGYRDAITWASEREDVNSAKIGVWGTSFSGGHALTVAAFDRRVKAVVSQVPFISGYDTLRMLVPPHHLRDVRANLDGDRVNRFRGGEPALIPVVTEDAHGPAFLPGADALEWFTKTSQEMAPNWKNELTVRSLEMLTEYDPRSVIHRISPTPLLMIVADDDTCAPFELALDAYERAVEPKQLQVTNGGHFDFYAGAGFETSATAARDHFVKHLIG